MAMQSWKNVSLKCYQAGHFLKLQRSAVISKFRLKPHIDVVSSETTPGMLEKYA
jgi:hypothetical protein